MRIYMRIYIRIYIRINKYNILVKKCNTIIIKSKFIEFLIIKIRKFENNIRK